MRITSLRDELEEARLNLEHGQTAEALDHIDAALHGLDADRLLTTTEAAEMLGIRSVNTLKLWLRTENIATVQRGNRTMIPISEVERLQKSERRRELQASDRVHDATARLGVDAGLSRTQLADLEAARPGGLPCEASTGKSGLPGEPDNDPRSR